MFARKLLHSIFHRLIRSGGLTIIWPDESRTRYGNLPGPSATCRIADWATVRRIAANPALAFGEAYMDGTLRPLECDIYDVLDTILTNMQAGFTHPMLRLHRRARDAVRRLSVGNGKARAARNVAHHYDLRADFYRLFLDRDMQYSCAYFPRGQETLEEAQQAKKQLIASKLLMSRRDLSVLDIGCGWGGLALTLARDYGARVTGITLSREQLAIARRRAAEAGLSDRVTFLRADYRDMDARFDRVVSVGMMEHVGATNYDAFFAATRRCLAKDGVALIHYIGRSDGPGATAAWILKYIFPGGYVPALSEVMPSLERSGLIATDIEILRLHYARTIRLWRERFAAHRDVIATMYDERFCRMFEFYLAGAELGFRRERQVVFQLQLSPELETVPLTRGYLSDRTPQLAAALAQ